MEPIAEDLPDLTLLTEAIEQLESGVCSPTLGKKAKPRALPQEFADIISVGKATWEGPV